jgi:hypothetical protein
VVEAVVDAAGDDAVVDAAAPELDELLLPQAATTAETTIVEATAPTCLLAINVDLLDTHDRIRAQY